ncbi:hypothetical protein [Flavilitoribacter nigricans]|uniref:Uncharacterized protein n=1 Tax=Flavilitoribacter nigricans (strain ATCC 23147 / DSM 23189 / NBRC 102662 / NCIMB 1420 / SS-2) TaxID=1122177 RepID=A0A2D0NGK5_FLAN2|nr:hypothetical protein [Flavilitoribacter nigricans]PHN07516.1 hypothetical protein CRP01_05285 [Flavilitoribacter nigricans DSM 23189 = NBRC 102662]
MLKKLKKLLTEMVPVILGILIALFINNWKESTEDEQFLDRAFAAIDQEIEENRTSIQNALTTHENLMDTIGVYQNSGGKSLEAILIDTDGLKYSTVRNTVWKFFVGSKTELIDYQVISQLSSIEESKLLMDAKFNKLMDFLYLHMDRNDPQSLRLFAIHLSNVMNSEQRLIEMYDEYLAGKED